MTFKTLDENRPHAKKLKSSYIQKLNDLQKRDFLPLVQVVHWKSKKGVAECLCMLYLLNVA